MHTYCGIPYMSATNHLNLATKKGREEVPLTSISLVLQILLQFSTDVIPDLESKRMSIHTDLDLSIQKKIKHALPTEFQTNLKKAVN